MELQVKAFGQIDVTLQLETVAVMAIKKVKLDPDCPVGQLKEDLHILGEINISPDQQVWIYKGGEMADDSALNDIISGGEPTIIIRRLSQAQA